MTRETLKCPSCGLNQFVNASETCKRCKRLMRLPVAAEAVPVAKEPTPAPWRHYSSAEGDAFMRQVAVCVKAIRLERNLSQRQLAARIPCPRTYISKVENGGAQPTVVSLTRIAGGLNISAWQILKNAEEAMHKEAR